MQISLAYHATVRVFKVNVISYSGFKNGNNANLSDDNSVENREVGIADQSSLISIYILISIVDEEI